MDNSALHPRLRNPARTDYIGDSDTDVLAFISNLARRMETAGPQAFGLSADDAALIIEAQSDYEAAYGLANSNSTRTASAIIRKNETRDHADTIARRYAQMIKLMPQISAALKVSAGVPIEQPARTPIGSPRTFPHLHVSAGGPPSMIYEVKVRFRDSALATARMPREDGITHMILQGEIALQGRFTMQPAAERVIAHLTRNPFTLRFDRDLLERFGLVEELAAMRLRAAEIGETSKPLCLGVMLRGQWLNAKGKVGPFGPPAMFSVPLPNTAQSAGQAEGAQSKLKLAA